MKKTIFWLLGLISLGLIFIKPVFSWSSFTPTGIFATHQFLTKMAYDHLSKHPALEYLDFPSLDEILVYAGVSASYNFQDGLAITGEGPDNSKHSIYSSHWYNPKNGGKGETPESARKHFDLLKKKLGMKPPSKIDPVASNKTHWPAAKDAAWLAHFIQDMTCPFHVVGMPKNEVSENKVGRSDVVGPFRTFDPRSWAVVVQRSRGDKHGKGANWFDPSYYDGLSFEPVMTGTHFLYEALVEIEYQKAILENFSTIRNALGRDYVSKGWKPSMKIEDFVKAVAKKTRENSPGR